MDRVLEEFAAGARNAVRVCLNIGSRDRVFVIRDRPRIEIAEAIEEEAASAGAEVRAWTMEDHVPRPVSSFPTALADEIMRFRPTASLFIGTGLVGELGFRKPMLTLLGGFACSSALATSSVATRSASIRRPSGRSARNLAIIRRSGRRRDASSTAIWIARGLLPASPPARGSPRICCRA